MSMKCLDCGQDATADLCPSCYYKRPAPIVNPREIVLIGDPDSPMNRILVEQVKASGWWDVGRIKDIVPDVVEPAVCHHCQGGIGHDGEPYCQADCPTITEPHAITRELAARDVLYIDNGYYICALCGVDLGTSGDIALIPAHHEPTCLWRRARELHPQP